MKKLEIVEMQTIEGGECSGSYSQGVTLASVGLIVSIAGCFGGPVGVALCAPTGIGLAIGGLYCAITA